MATTTLGSSPTFLVALVRSLAVRCLAFLGQGEDMRLKIWPAVCANGHCIDRIAVCSLEPTDLLGGPPHTYHCIGSDSRLPLDRLEVEGFLCPETLWIIATPTPSHVHYARQLAGFSRVAIEKPLAVTSAEAKLLQPYAHKGFEVYAIDHKLFNPSALTFVDACRQNHGILCGIWRIEGRFFETAGLSHGRQQEDCIADVQHHLLVPIRAAFQAAGEPVEMPIDKVCVASHTPDPKGLYAAPKVWTFSWLQGRVVWSGRTIPFDLLQAKGAPRNEKSIRFYDSEDRLVSHIDLGETSWQAHGRVLAELLKPHPDLRYSLSDAIAMMEIIDRARTLASVEPDYPFGTLPGIVASA